MFEEVKVVKVEPADVTHSGKPGEAYLYVSLSCAPSREWWTLYEGMKDDDASGLAANSRAAGGARDAILCAYRLDQVREGVAAVVGLIERVNEEYRTRHARETAERETLDDVLRDINDKLKA